MPTVNCLVELVESPATVVAMPSVAIVNLERVGFNLRNFDMVIVFKVCCHFSFVSSCLVSMHGQMCTCFACSVLLHALAVSVCLCVSVSV